MCSSDLTILVSSIRAVLVKQILKIIFRGQHFSEARRTLLVFLDVGVSSSQNSKKISVNVLR